MVQQKSDETGSHVGWKVGATNDKAMTYLKLSEPLRGPLFSNFVHNTETGKGVHTLQWTDMGRSLLAAEVEQILTLRMQDGL